MTLKFPWSMMIVLVLSSAGHAEAPEVTFTSPLAVTPGQRNELAFHGKYLEGATRVWTGFSAETTFLTQTSEPVSDSNSTRATSTVASDVPVGIYAARVTTREGVSQPILMMVDDLPSIGEQSKHQSRETAQQVHPPVAVDGAGDGSESDFYCFDASLGQWFTIEVVASRLGYSFDASLRIFDESGQEIAVADDTPGLNGDCRLRFQAAQRQRYFVEVCDATFSNSARHKYRLRVGDFPLVTTTFPLAISHASQANVSHEFSQPSIGFCHVDGTIAPPAVTNVSMFSNIASMPISTRFRHDGGSAMARYAASPLPNVAFVDYQPNDCKERALVVEAPVAVNGVFREAGDSYFYRLPLSAGNRRRIHGITRSLGSPADLLLKVVSPDGTLLSSHDDSGLDEASFEIEAKLDGAYLLSVQEINGQHGSGYSYRIEVTESQVGFELSAKANRVIIGQGGVGLLPVQCQRFGYKGPITLRIDGPDVPYQLDNQVIEAEKMDTLLKLIPSRDLQPGDLQMLRIVGYGEASGIELKKPVSIVDEVRAQLPAVPYPPGELWDQIAVAVAQPLPDFFALRLASQQVLFPRIVGDAYFTVFCTDRIDGYTEAIHVQAKGLPEGFSTSGYDRPVGNSKNNEYRFELRGPADFPAGKHTISIHATGMFRGQTKEVQIDEIPFQVIDPLIMSLESSQADVKPGEVAIRVNAKRFVGRGGGDRKEIHCSWKKRPDWLIGSDKFVIGVGKNEETVRMSVTASHDGPAPVGQLVLVAETLVEGKTVQVESETFELQYPASDKPQ